jgi:hypothetical protein
MNPQRMVLAVTALQLLNGSLPLLVLGATNLVTSHQA